MTAVAPEAPAAAMATMAGMRLTPADLARLFDGRLEGSGDALAMLSGIETDSRQISRGRGFIALRGERDDGHRHVPDAAQRECSVAVVDATWQPAAGTAVPPLILRVDDTGAGLRRACRARLAELGCEVVGITGSVGKTTAKEMCATALGRLAVARTPGNLNTWTGVPQTVLSIDPPVDVFVAEVAMSAPGEIRDLARMLRPRVGVLLNIGYAHIGLLGSLVAISDAKAELLEELPEDGIAVCNADDERVRAVAGRSPAPPVWFGLRSSEATYTARDISSDGVEGTRCVLHGPGGTAITRLPLRGEHAVLDACAAAAVAAQHGVAIAEVARRLAGLTPPEHRGAVLVGARGALVYDDCYNSSPTSLHAALEVLAGCPRSRRVAVLGDMLELGDHAAAAHREAGRHAASVATGLIAVGEHAETMVTAAVAAGMPASEARVAADVDEAARLTLTQCDGDTAILVKASHSLAFERIVEQLIP